MRSLSLLLLWVLALCACGPPSFGALRERVLEKWRWRVFTPRSGLPERNFSALFQARNGLYYAASGHRVFLYDGYRWQELPFAGAAHPAEPVRLLTEDRNGTVFAATRTELWALRLGDAFRQIYQGSEPVVTTSPDRKVYFLAEGYLHRLEGTRIHRLQAVDPVPAQRVYCLAVDAEQTVWVGTDRGLLRQEGLSWRTDPELGPLDLENRPCRGLFVAGGQTLWASIYHPERGWILARRSQDHWEAGLPGAPQSPILALTGYPGGVVYASTEEGGLYRFSPARSWRYFPRLWAGSVVVTAAIVDDRQALWFCLRAIGIARFEPRSDRWEEVPLGIDIRRDRVLSLLRTSTGALWVGTEQCLLRRAGGRIERFSSSPGGSVAVTHVTGLAEDSRGRIWVTSEQAFPGALVIEGENWSRFRLPPPYEEVRLRRIEVDSQRRLWLIAAEDDLFGGVWLVDGDHVQRFGTDEGLVSDRVLAVEVASDGSIWIGTDRGLARLSDSRASTVRYFTQQDGLVLDRIWDIAESRDGSMWVAYQVGGGVSRYRKKSWEHYGSAEGLANESVWTVAPSADGDVWFGTQAGISRFDGSAFYNYEVGEEPLLSSAWVLVPLPTERGVLAGTPASGVLYFRRTDTDPPQLFLLPGPQEIPFGQPVRLSWGSRDRFDQTPSEELLYFVRLDGGAWGPPQKEASFATAHLTCGSHVLEVQARDQDGNKAVFPLRVTFRVEPPWYRRAPFLALLSGVAVIFLTGHVLGIAYLRKVRRMRQRIETILTDLGASILELDRKGSIRAVTGAAPVGLSQGSTLTDAEVGQLEHAVRGAGGGTAILGAHRLRVFSLGQTHRRRYLLLARSAETYQEFSQAEMHTEGEQVSKVKAREGTSAFSLNELLAEVARNLPPQERTRFHTVAPLPELLWRVQAQKADCVEIVSSLIREILRNHPRTQVTLYVSKRRLSDGPYLLRFVELQLVWEGGEAEGKMKDIFSHITPEARRLAELSAKNAVRLSPRPPQGLRVLLPAVEP